MLMLMVNEHNNLHFLVTVLSNLFYPTICIMKHSVPGNTYLAFNFTAYISGINNIINIYTKAIYVICFYSHNKGQFKLGMI